VIWGMLATLAATFFAGAAVYINLVEHPARMSCGVPAALAQWRPSYRRATVMQASLAVVGALAGIAAWWQDGNFVWLGGAAFLVCIVVFSLTVILPTNHRLEDRRIDDDPAAAQPLLAEWARLHAVRSVLGCAAALLYALALERV
jgi:anthrone oxygenase-like protein